MSGFPTIIYEKRGSLAYVTLNRPQFLNAYNIQMRDDLYQVLGAIKDDSEVRVAILKGAGEKAFCAGADLTEFLTAPSAALHGYVLGSGIEMALFCDIRIASDDTRFGLPEVGLGIIPAAGGTQTLPRVVGQGKALEMLLTNPWVSGEEAYRVGLVNKVVPRDELLQTAEAMARQIASYDPNAVRAAKQAALRGLNLTLAKGIDLEKRLASEVVLAAGQGS
ncbi:MAG: enoyl-CoA hydratase/carnithine racemase [bacterium]|nr:MAG: enoyl-CoA hydratase/carnithine racemase [bacterium]